MENFIFCAVKIAEMLGFGCKDIADHLKERY